MRIDKKYRENLIYADPAEKIIVRWTAKGYEVIDRSNDRQIYESEIIYKSSNIPSVMVTQEQNCITITLHDSEKHAEGGLIIIMLSGGNGEGKLRTAHIDCIGGQTITDTSADQRNILYINNGIIHAYTVSPVKGVIKERKLVIDNRFNPSSVIQIPSGNLDGVCVIDGDKHLYSFAFDDKKNTCVCRWILNQENLVYDQENCRYLYPVRIRGVLTNIADYKFIGSVDSSGHIETCPIAVIYTVFMRYEKALNRFVSPDKLLDGIDGKYIALTSRLGTKIDYGFLDDNYISIHAWQDLFINTVGEDDNPPYRKIFKYMQDHNLTLTEKEAKEKGILL